MIVDGCSLNLIHYAERIYNTETIETTDSERAENLSIY